MQNPAHPVSQDLYCLDAPRLLRRKSFFDAAWPAGGLQVDCQFVDTAAHNARAANVDTVINTTSAIPPICVRMM